MFRLFSEDVVLYIKYTATADTTVSEGKVYYAKTDNGYIVGKPKTDPKTEGFYEIA